MVQSPSARVTGDRPRVLFFSHETTLSGAPIALFHLVCWLQENGWRPEVAVPDSGPISQLLDARGIRVFTDSTFLTDPAHERLNEVCRGFDVVVANTIASWPAILAGRRANARAVWYLHETLVAIDLIGKISEIRPTLDQAHLLITPTQQTANVYRGITRTAVEVVPYGIPEPPSAQADNDTQRLLKFVALGSYEPRKGQDVLVQAIRQLTPEVRAAASFTIAGRVLDEAFFARLSDDAADLENLELASALDHAGSLRMLAEADVLVCASRDETMPISIIEAMSLGKCVLSTDVGGISEWLRDQLNGLVVPPEEPSRLASAITDAVALPELRRSCGAAARRTFDRHFTLARFGARFAAALQRIVEGSPTMPRSDPDERYREWVVRYDTPGAADRIELARKLRTLAQTPRISVVLPVYNPDLKLLLAAVDSVRQQVYEKWELCIADDASTDPAVRPFLKRLSAADRRIRVTYRATNGHISAASNSALELATGEWCALLDQDDAFVDHALATVALEIAAHSDARVIYSDEDKIDVDGNRSNPFFKPDWNPELFQGQNYINHLGVYHTELLRSVGAFRTGFEGSQDYDVASRCTEGLRAEQVRHIPRILYHWRMAPGSLAEVPDAKPYAKEAARRALADHLKRRGIPGRVEPCPENAESHRVIYELPDERPHVTIIIPTRDQVALLQQCLRSVGERTEYSPYDVLIIDNGSTDRDAVDYLQTISSWAGVTVVRDNGPFNFSRLNNVAARHARGEILAFLNNDIEVTESGWLAEMVSHAARSEVGAVGARLWYPDGTLQHGGVVLGLGGVAGHAHYRVPRGHPGYFNRAWLQQNCSAVTAACMLTRKAVFMELGGFDENNLSINFNDIDYCIRVGARGLQILWTPYANLAHHESASRGHHPTPAQQAQFRREATFMQETHGRALLHDAFYSPNLTLKLPGYEIAFPPRD